MTRDELQRYIFDHYSTEPDYPWADAPNHAVFRHGGNRKWFALVLDVPRNKLGLPGTQMIDVVNLKCDPILIGSLRGEPGIFPAYHMNKDRWLSVALTAARRTISSGCCWSEAMRRRSRDRANESSPDTADT